MSTPEFTGQEINYGYKKAIHSDSELVKKQNHTSRKQLTRCKICNKKVGVVLYTCKCNTEYIFCGKHKLPNNHECTFDFKEYYITKSKC